MSAFDVLEFTQIDPVMRFSFERICPSEIGYYIVLISSFLIVITRLIRADLFYFDLSTMDSDTDISWLPNEYISMLLMLFCYLKSILILSLILIWKYKNLLTKVSSMFYICTSLREIRISWWIICRIFLK